MDDMRLSLLAMLGSMAVLAGAYGFQHLGGMAPCSLCIWQRWPHATAIAIGLIIALTGESKLAYGAALASLTSAGVGLYHVGVEQSWWEGPATCTSAAVSGLSPQELMDRIMAAPLVRCDDIAWQLAGISMAGWNVIVSLILVGVWAYVALRD